MAAKGLVAPEAASGQEEFSRLLFENERVRISDFVLPPSSSCIEVRLDFPAVRWQVNSGKHTLRVEAAPDEALAMEENRSSVEEEVPDKRVFFVEAGTVWRLQNTGAGDYRQIIWEIKQPPKYTEEEVEARLKHALYSTEVGTELLFENHLCRVWDFYLEPHEGGGPQSVHHHVLDYAFVYVAPGRLLGFYPDLTPGLFDSINKNNDVTWFSIPEDAPQSAKWAHGGKNGYSTPMREYLVELK